MTTLRQLEHALRLHDRVIVRERVKSLHPQAAGAGFNADEAHGAQGHPAAGIEDVQQAIVRRIAIELGLKRPENFRRDGLEFVLGFTPGR